MPVTEFYRRTHGLRQDQVDRQAKSLAQKAGMFNRRIDLRAIGDVNVDPNKEIALTGTETAWDRTYYIMSVTFVFDEPEEPSEYGGCTMTIDGAEIPGGLSPLISGGSGITLPSVTGSPDTFGADPGVLGGDASLLSPQATPGANDGFAGQ